jgi:hypothetical protein
LDQARVNREFELLRHADWGKAFSPHLKGVLVAVGAVALWVTFRESYVLIWGLGYLGLNSVYVAYLNPFFARTLQSSSFPGKLSVVLGSS